MKIFDKTLELENKNFKVIAFDNERYEKNNRKHLYYKIKCKRCGDIFSRKKAAFHNFDNIKCRKCIHDRFGKSLNTSLYDIYIHYIHNAKVRKIFWNLTEDNFKDIIIKPCLYCGQFTKTLENISYSGIDRIDSLKDYSINNCVPCCKLCNMMKNKFSKAQFLLKVEQIYNKSIKSSTTISKESTSQANGDGKGELLNAV